MEESLFNQGVMLMLAGMGTVFVFLGLLVAAMTAMAALVARNGAEPGGAGPSIGMKTLEISRPDPSSGWSRRLNKRGC